MSATAIHAPQLPRRLEQIRQRAEALYAERTGLIGMTPHDWLKAELELKQANQITNN